MQCVILAGGMGTRMLPLTSNKPKSLLDVNGKPFIYYQLKWLEQYDITSVLINIGHLGSMIRDYININLDFSFPVDYVDEGDNLLGTAGALRLAYDQNKLDPIFLTLYGDSFLPINFNDICDTFRDCPADSALMTIYHNKNAYDKSNVNKNIDNTIIYDKNNDDANYIDYGLSILKSDIIKTYVEKNTYYKLADLFNKLSLHNKLIGREVFDRFFEIGSFDGLKDFTDWINVNYEIFNNS